MKSSSKEVNIFNMSLMDVLCGALGAFCFLTIALFPYYRPNLPQMKSESSANVQQMEEQIKKLMDQIAQGGGGGAAAAAALQQLQRQLADLQDQLARYQQALANADKRVKQLEVRRPMVFTAHWAANFNVDLYVQDFTGKMENPTLAKRQWAYWTGDVGFDRNSAPGYEVWMNRDMPQGSYKVFVKLMGEPQPSDSGGVWLSAMYGREVINFGSVTLTGQNRIIQAVEVLMARDGRITFKPGPALVQAEDLKKKLAEPPPAPPAQ